MAVEITYDDLVPFAPNLDEAKAELMIADAMALAALVAPCILTDDLSEEEEAAAVAILRGVILRWNDQGTASGPALVAGVFQMTPNAKERKAMLYPSEIKDLSTLCGTASSTRRAYTVDMIPAEDVV